MMTEGSRKVLLTIDGSDESLEVARYVCESVPASETEVVIYQVVSKVPEVFWDLGRDPSWLPKIEAVREFEQKQEAVVTSFMNKVFTLFQDAGFRPGSVTTRIGTQQEGLARDIVAESRQGGYGVVVIGRGKKASAPEMPLGSVASKVISAAPGPAIWLVGGQPSSDNILIAIDASDNSIQAAKHAGKMFQHHGNRFTLFHAIRGISVSMEGMEEIFPESYRQRLLDDAEREIRPSMEMAELWLNKLGIPSERISTKIVSGVASRAAAIIQEAREGGYGTIVAGRRGISKVADFSMGRVTNKLTQLAKEQSLCIVG